MADMAANVLIHASTLAPGEEHIMTALQIKRAEIWIACLGKPNGSEQRGTRPVLVIQNDVGNFHSPTVIVASITKAFKVGLPTHVPITVADSGLEYDSSILLEQIRTIDKTALGKRISILPDNVMLRVEYALMISVGLIPVGILKEEEL